MKRNYVISIFFGFWFYFWFHASVVKPLFKGDRTKYFAVLLPMSTEEKKSFIVGEPMYELIQFALKHLPPQSHYGIVGIKRTAIEHRYADYYLYPHYSYLKPVMNESADYILVYKLKDFSKEGYEVFQKIDQERYILKRKIL